jgi:hypothetical protein
MKPLVDLTYIYDEILVEMDVTQEEINYELMRYAAGNIHEMQKDPDEKQKSWIDSIPYQGITPQEIHTPNKKEYKSWSKQKRNWFTFFNGAEYMWDYVMYLTEHEKYVDREKATKFKQKVLNECPLLCEFIRKLPMDIQGRVIFLGVNPRQQVYKHADNRNTSLPECILMNFGPHQKLMSIEGYKIKIRCAVFDERLPHTLNGGNTFTYTLRIDGKWTKELSLVLKNN